MTFLERSVFAKRIGPRSRQPQALEAQQDRERPFELTVEMDLVAAERLQLVRIERRQAFRLEISLLAKCLLTDQRAISRFLPARLEPQKHLALQKAPKSLSAGGGGLVALVHFVGATGEGFRPSGKSVPRLPSRDNRE